MSDVDAGTTNQPDPMEKFRELRDAYLEIWSKNLRETVNTEGYAQASGAALDTYLNASAPYKEAAEQAMLRTLQQLNMPTSVDFAGLAGRFTNIEMQLDSMDAKLDRIEKQLSRPQPVTPAESRMPMPSGRRTAPVRSAKMSPETPEQPAVPVPAKKRRYTKKSALEALEIPKRTTTAKPLRRNARKGTK